MQKEILLSYFPKITHRRYLNLLKNFGTLDSAWQAEFSDFIRSGWEEDIAREFFAWKKDCNLDEIQETLNKENIYPVTQSDPRYPALLKEIYDPPLCLFVRGSLEDIFTPLAVVGTRKWTQYGKQVTEDIVKDLARSKMTIVSGLALGIDAIAHEATIQNNGKTIAVLGGGVDTKTLYPRNHTHLAEKIVASGGAVLSEYPPATKSTPYSFPRRNRIVAGMTLGVLVIEAQERSGALITAASALEWNREVFAIPQNITSSTSVGPNNLIKMGAHPVTQSQDILMVFDLPPLKTTPLVADSPTEESILQVISRDPLHIDEIKRQSGLASDTLSSTLTIMEIKGMVRNLGGMMYCRNVI